KGSHTTNAAGNGSVPRATAPSARARTSAGVAGVLFRASLPRLPAGGELSEPEPNAEGAVLASGHGSEPAAGAKTGLARAEGHRAHLWRSQAVARTGAEPLPRAGTDGDSGAADLPGAQRQEDGLSIQRCAWTSERASAPGTGGCVSRSAPVGSRTKWKDRKSAVPHVPSSRWQPSPAPCAKLPACFAELSPDSSNPKGREIYTS